MTTNLGFQTGMTCLIFFCAGGLAGAAIYDRQILLLAGCALPFAIYLWRWDLARLAKWSEWDDHQKRNPTLAKE